MPALPCCRSMPPRSPSSRNACLSATPAELPVIRDALKSHRSTLVPKLWSTLDSAKPGDVSLLPAASALADYDGTSPRWEAVGGKVAQALVTVNPVYLGDWLDALRPVREKLTAPLATIFRDKKRPETERTLATSILTDYASDDPNLIANLLMDADPKAYAAFFPIAQRHETKTLTLFQAEIAKKATIPDSDKDSETVKDQLAERQARAAVALFRMGKVEEVLPLLRHSPDPRLRSFIVNWLSPLGADPKVLAAELDRIPATPKPTPAQGQQFMDAMLFHPETSMRRALILALGTVRHGGPVSRRGSEAADRASCSTFTRTIPTLASMGRRNGPYGSGGSRRVSKKKMLRCEGRSQANTAGT